MGWSHGRILTKELVKDVAAKYKNRAAFQKEDSPAYVVAWKFGFLDEICSHMKPLCRKFTNEDLRKIALQYRSRSEFQHKDCSAYTVSRRRGILDDICSHMVNLSFSIPQLMCKQLFDQLLKAKGTYNDRSIVSPWELDIYYASFQFAVEYHGKRWHENIETQQNDINKANLCSKRNIFLFVIKETSRRYEEDIKYQIMEALPKINEYCQTTITNVAVQNAQLDYDKLFCLYDEQEIINAIKKCKNIADFHKRHPHYYRILRQLNKLDKLENIRQIKIKTDEELLDIAKTFSNYGEFVKRAFGVYLSCRKRNLLALATKHMKRGRPPNLTKENVIALASNLSLKEFKQKYPGAYDFARRKELLEILFSNN